MIEITRKSNLSVCKLIKYGKFQYLESKKLVKIKKKKKECLKEMRFRLFIGDNDFKNKLDKIKNFLFSKFRVKVSLFIRGREIFKKKIIENLVKNIIFHLSNYSILENTPKLNEKNIVLFFTFKKNR